MDHSNDSPKSHSASGESRLLLCTEADPDEVQRVDNQESQGFHPETTLDQMAAEFSVAKQILKADWTLLSERRAPSNFWFIFICFVGNYALHEHGKFLSAAGADT